MTTQSTIGPACDYEGCARHWESMTRSMKRRYYCTAECRDNQRKLTARRNRQHKEHTIRTLLEQHRAQMTRPVPAMPVPTDETQPAGTARVMSAIGNPTARKLLIATLVRFYTDEVRDELDAYRIIKESQA